MLSFNHFNFLLVNVKNDMYDCMKLRSQFSTELCLSLLQNFIIQSSLLLALSVSNGICCTVPGLSHVGYLKLLLLGCGIPAVGWLLAFVSILLVAVVLDVFNSSMSWFRRPGLIFTLYYCPVLIFCMVCPVLFQNFTNKQASKTPFIPTSSN